MKKGNVKLVRDNFLQKNEDDFEAQDLASKEENDGTSLEEEENDSSEEEEDDISEEEELQDHLIDIPFEELQRVRSDGRESSHGKFKKETKPSRANKNRPMEMSSKKPVGRLREVVQAPKKVIRDPRFESLCGNYDESRFKKLYSFIFDEELPMERKKLQKTLEKSKDPKAVEEMKKHISWIDNQLRTVQEGNKYSEKLSEHKKNEKEAVKQGKRPFYLKKSEVRKQQLIEKYKSLKASGKLEAFLAKRRQKNAAKDHRYVPYRRPDTVH
ncbi:uncharacterized protein LOC131041777 [Cryptomeria japonica]|uniref:uncharacterized protein LOC131041777 n=1 Tax=Cryptomeria japonica TaxID=3369 RepID=UPI0025ACECA7|nr:uncharacterized protein LOC131041777 [Cryptomeria japonica]XP_057830961.1 uncharacterized protein LOC131041777 [Cryptomeria japonica]XP_057830963.1 uncharacterized protein LOC131041777 [Cryptomeria japonica]XP_057830964.1 uncharacterized protein LOC131041777 [Cryptomeria japonica]XP_057830966.1 uncharacterized protein LOC131041777 [Cryptomeria japonica]XP_059069108.1 uncharacterized protein LOC131041777 [Cryptomeria japonica]